MIAGSPELYPEVVRLGAVPPVLALLSHDNSDIAASALELLRELTDSDVVEDSVRARRGAEGGQGNQAAAHCCFPDSPSDVP